MKMLVCRDYIIGYLSKRTCLVTETGTGFIAFAVVEQVLLVGEFGAAVTGF